MDPVSVCGKIKIRKQNAQLCPWPNCHYRRRAILALAWCAFSMRWRRLLAPIDRWRKQIPKAMFIKSEGCASRLSSPLRLTTAQFFADEGLPHRDYRVPPASLAHCGLLFQKNLVPSVEHATATVRDRRSDDFEIGLSTGETITATKVVVATGLSHQPISPGRDRRAPTALGHRRRFVVGADVTACTRPHRPGRSSPSPHSYRWHRSRYETKGIQSPSMSPVPWFEMNTAYGTRRMPWYP
jgi:hypothetical protein